MTRAEIGNPRTHHAPARGYLLVVSLAPYDASCTLFFTHLASRLPLRIVQYPIDDIAGPLSGASAVVLVRGLFEFGNLIPCAHRLGVPRYYFLDDNFMLIREEAATYGSQYERYTNERVRSVLRDFSGVLLATGSLIEYFARERLHDHVLLYPPVAGSALALPVRDVDHPMTVAFLGGMHRRAPFERFVYPALCRVARDRSVTLVAAGFDPGSLPAAPGVEVRYPPYDPSYTAALDGATRYGIDILVHPSSDTANNIYKNPHVLINARAIGAAPIFSNVAPYAAVAAEQVAVLCENTEDAWYDAIARVASDASLRQRLQTRLEAYCQRHFGGGLNAEIIGTMLHTHPAPDRLTRFARLTGGAACLAAGHARRRIAGKINRSLGR